MKKQHNTHKLTPEILKEITDIAKTLPKFQKYKNGKPLNRVLHIQKIEVEPGKYKKLKICEPVLVNHEVNLRSDYQTHGRQGIDNYVAECKKMVEQYKEDPTFQQMNN